MPHRYRLLLLAALPLGGCSVYVPMQGAAPDISRQGELEVSGSYSFTNRVDASVAYSPLPHVLARAAVSRKGTRREPTDTDSSQYGHVGQVELALGTYWPLGERWLVGALAGYGHLQADGRFYGDSGQLLIPQYQAQHAYDGRYHKLLGEAYGRFRASDYVSLGASYRLANLYLTDITDRGQPLPSVTIPRAEWMLFVRYQPDTEPEGLLQLQFSLGGSVMPGYASQSFAYYNDPTRPFRIGQAYSMFTLSFYPSAWWQRK